MANVNDGSGGGVGPSEGNYYDGSGGGGGTSSFNYNSLIDSITSSLGPTLNGIAGIISSVHGNPAIAYGQNGQPVYVPTLQQQQQVANSNTILYIVIALVVLMFLLGAAYLFTRK